MITSFLSRDTSGSKRVDASNVVLTDRRLKELAIRLLLPGLLLNVTVGNQLWMLGPFYLGQFIFWPLIACAALVVILSFPNRLWPIGLVVLVVGGRVLRDRWQGSGLELLYFLPLWGLFAIAGAIAASQQNDRVYRQLRLYFILSVPFMIMQVAGVGDWTMALNTETTGLPEEIAEQGRDVKPTLFVPASEASYTIGQGRPAGFMHANNILSLAIIFGLALQFGRIRSTRVTWTDALFCAAVVLSMAKIVILAFLVMVGFLLWRGPALVRRRMVGVLGLTIALYAVYAFFFPGVFAIELSSSKIAYSTFIRLNDFLTVLGPVAALGGLGMLLEGTARYDYASPEDVGHLSGYSVIAGLLPQLIPLALLLILLYRRGLSVVEQRSPLIARTAHLVLICVLVFPAAVPIWDAPLFWFIAGFAMLPALLVLTPGLRNRIRLLPVSATA